MADRNKIVQFCKEYLKVSEFSDYCHNGLQVEGTGEVNKIVTGVSFSQALIDKAIEAGADMIIVHHGIFKLQIGELPQIKGVMRGRLKALLENDINLCGFHLPLDAHKEIGNNASLCKLFGVDDLRPFDVGYIGELKTETTFDNFVTLVNKKLETNSYVIAAGADKVKTIGVVSGGASPDFQMAAEMGADVFVCGDVREEVVRGVEELGINFINAGHYNTEKLGIINLGEKLSKEFGIEVVFIDVPNEV